MVVRYIGKNMSYGMQGSLSGNMPKNKTPRGYSSGRMQNFTPEQMQLFQQMFGNVAPDSYTSRLAGGDQSLFEESERPALQQFSQLQGGLASRFSGMGTGARRSSGFQNTMNQATSDFASGLQSRRQELQRQAIKDLMGMSGELLSQKPQENFLVPKSKPWWQEMLTGIGGSAAKAGVEQGFKYGFGG